MLTVPQAAAELGISKYTIYRWLRDGFITGEQLTPAAPWRIRIDQALRDKIAPCAPAGWLPLDQAAATLGISRQTVLHKVQRGELQAVLVNRGQRQGLRIQVERDQAGLFDTPDKEKGAVLTMAGRPEEDHVVAGGGEVQGAQVGDHLAAQAAGVVEVELFQGLAGREPRRADAAFPAVGLARGDLALQAGGQEFLMGPGEYYASPALAHLLRTVPADQLGDRFPGTLAGVIGNAALDGPDELAIFVGYTPRALELPGSRWVTTISTSPGPEVFTPFFRYAFATGVLAVLFPVLILISTATRLAAARREERFAALRLVGATRGDISVIASVDSVVSALLGGVVGIGVFLAVQPALAAVTLTGTRYFASTVNPAVWEYPVLLVVVPLASAVASLLALRRVQISPLGVTRRATPPPPSPWRLAPLAAGVVLYIAGALATSSEKIGVPTYPGLLVTLIGLVIAGPWLTSALARLSGRVLSGASPLLATKRLAVVC